MRLDLGDVVLALDLRVKGRVRRRIRIRVGAPTDSTPADRVVNGPPYATTISKEGPLVDLQADKKIPLSIQWTDEVGNATDAPTDAVVTYTTDNPTVISLTDNGDGTAVAAATGTLGAANVHVEATANGDTLTGDLAINVVAGLAERITVVAGDPEEVTPDA